MTVQELMEEACRIALAHGFGVEEEPNVGEFIALVHTELSEAFDGWRKGDGLKTIRTSQEIVGNGLVKAIKPDGFPVELADAVIRICQWCQRYGIPLREAIEMKMAYNETRPYKHGGRRC